MSADLVFVNSEVITMERGRPNAEAVAVAGGRIVAVGATDSVRALANGAQVVDLKGRTMLPGFVEAHGHPTLEIMTVLPPTVDVRPFFVHDHDEVVAKIKETLAALPPGTPQAFYGYDPVLCPGAHKLERGELDAIAPDHPIVVLNNSGHAGYANTRMLAAAGINRDTPDPVGSQYERDSAGEPTGVALETAALIALTKPYFERVMAESSMPDLLRREFEMYAHTGVTTASDMAFDRQSRALFASYSATPGALTRIVTYEKSDGGLKSDVLPGWGDDMFRQAGIKLWADGSPWIGRVLGPEHRITPLEALRAQTIDAAWQLFMEDRVGSVTPGKFADLVVLDGNPLATDPERLTELNVVETYLGGRQVHQA